MTHIGEQEKKKKFEQFFILTFPKVKAFAWKILHSEEDAEDIAQDIFVKLWDNPEIWRTRKHGIVISIRWPVIRFITF